MLHPPDADLVSRDPDLPGLRVLLDDEAFADCLRRLCPQETIQSTRSLYIRYKPGTGCLVQFEVQANDQSIMVYGRTYASSTFTKFREFARRNCAQGKLVGGILFDEALPVAVFVFPFDQKLKILRDLDVDDTRRKLIQTVMPDYPELFDAPMTLLRYKPERRCVLRVGQPGAKGEEVAVMKFYAESEFQLAYANARNYKSTDRVKVARIIGRSRRRHILAFGWLKGETVSQMIPQHRAPGSLCTEIGRMLASLHAQQLINPSSDAPNQDETAALHEAIDAIRVVLPGLPLDSISHQLQQRLYNNHCAPVNLIHGDFSADQVLTFEDQLAVLDLDRATAGNPAWDLGSFIAALYRDVLDQRFDIEIAHACADALVTGYRQESNATAHSDLWGMIGLHLLKLAIEPFRYRQTNWADQIERYLDTIEHLTERKFAAI